MKDRKHPRFDVVVPVPVLNKYTQEVLGNVVNLSSGGLLLASQQPLDADQIYQIQLIVKDQGSELGEVIDVGIDCLWSKEGEQGLCFSGCQIIDCSDENEKRINDLLNALSETESEA